MLSKKSKVGSASKNSMFPQDSDEEDNKCVDIIKKYFIETSIHGLKYIFENGRHVSERIFWIISCVVLWSLGILLIYQVSILFNEK